MSQVNSEVWNHYLPKSFLQLTWSTLSTVTAAFVASLIPQCFPRYVSNTPVSNISFTAAASACQKKIWTFSKFYSTRFSYLISNCSTFVILNTNSHTHQMVTKWHFPDFIPLPPNKTFIWAMWTESYVVLSEVSSPKQSSCSRTYSRFSHILLHAQWL